MGSLEQNIKGRTFLEGGSAMISLADCIELSGEYGLPLKDIEICALQDQIIPARYERNIGTIGVEGQIRLLRSRVAVIGCGGLGGVVIEILARAGIGTLVIADGDVFSDSNLNRQLLSNTGDMGSSKVGVAVDRVRSINPAVEVRDFNVPLKEGTGPLILEDVDLAVDALDNNPSRKLLYSLCSGLSIPVVHGAIGGFIGQVGVFLPGRPTHLDLFGDGLTEKGAEAIAGVPSFAPYVVGSLEAAEAIKLLTGVGDVLKETLLLLDMSQNVTEFLPLDEGNEKPL